MVTVPCRQLKNRLGAYLGMVRAGQAIRVTDRGKPVACILPLATAEQEQTAELLSALLAKGSLTLGGGRLSAAVKPVVLKAGRSIAAMIAEGRR
jgi:prevent-host-death family protein